MEGVKARQLHNALLNEVRAVDKKIHHANLFLDLFPQKAQQFDEQVTFAYKNFSTEYKQSLGE